MGLWRRTAFFIRFLLDIVFNKPKIRYRGRTEDRKVDFFPSYAASGITWPSVVGLPAERCAILTVLVSRFSGRMRLTWRLTTNVLAETVKVEERLLDVIDELKADDMIAVNPLSEMVRSLPGFELSE